MLLGPLKTGVYSKLTGGQALVALLGKDPLGRAAVFNGTHNRLTQMDGWTFPAVTFRISEGRTDQRFRDSLADDWIVEIEIWHPDQPERLTAAMKDQAGSALTVPTIANEVDALMLGTPLVVTGGTVKDVSRLSAMLDQRDDSRAEHFGLLRYMVKLLE